MIYFFLFFLKKGVYFDICDMEVVKPLITSSLTCVEVKKVSTWKCRNSTQITLFRLFYVFSYGIQCRKKQTCTKIPTSFDTNLLTSTQNKVTSTQTYVVSKIVVSKIVV